MKKLEGIITVTGILLIIGLPMFLLFAGTDTSRINADSERLISINSYSEEKAVVKSIDIDSYEEDFDVLDGSKAREDVVILESLTPLAGPEIKEAPIVVETKTVIEEPLEELIVFEDFEDEVISENAVPEWLDISENYESIEAENKEEFNLVITDDSEEEELILLLDDNVPEGLDIFENAPILEEVIMEFGDEFVSETYEPGSYIPDTESAAYDEGDGEDEDISIIPNEVLPQGLDSSNLISFECSEMNDGFGSRVASVTYVNDDGDVVSTNFAY